MFLLSLLSFIKCVLVFVLPRLNLLAFPSYLRGKPSTNYYIRLNKVVVVKADGLTAKLTPERDLSMVVLGQPRVVKHCISQG